MFCPNCGKAEQKESSYCRACGEFIPDLSGRNKTAFGGSTPEEQIKMNLTLSLMSAIVSAILAIALYTTYFRRPDTPLIIYIVAAFLLTICAWQASTFSINLKLKKHFKKRRPTDDAETVQPAQNQFQAAKTKELLPEADLTDAIPASVMENTTRKLKIDN
jgi:hypothetical protein